MIGHWDNAFMADELKNKTAKGLAWGFINSGFTQLINLVMGIILARVLSKSDYGMVGVLAIFSAIAGQLQSWGFAQALTNKKEVTAEDYNAVFWFNISVSIICYIVLFFCAPYIADFYHKEELLIVSRVLFLSFVVSAFGIAHGAYMYRNLMVKQTALVSTVSLLVGGIIGVIFALCGFAYWSIVTQTLVMLIVANIMRYIIVPWHPGLHFKIKPLIPMLKFGSGMVLTNILTSINGNILSVFLGRFYPLSAVGSYTQANKWNGMASSMLTNTISQVAQPVMARISDDSEREKRAFRKMIRFCSFISFPCIFGLALISKEFIVATISTKWLESVPLLQVLCIGGAFMPMLTVYQNLVVSKGKSFVYLWLNVIQMLLITAMTFILRHYDVLILVGAYSALNIFTILFWQYFANKYIGIKLHEILLDSLPFMFVAGSIMIATYYFTQNINNIYVLLVAKIFIAFCLYCLLMKIMKVKMMDDCWLFLKDKLHLSN